MHYDCLVIFLLDNNDVRACAPVAQLVEHPAVTREFDSGRTNTQGLKITKEKVLPL